MVTWPFLLPGFQKIWANKRLSKKPEDRIRKRSRYTFAGPSPLLSFHFLKVAILPYDYNICLVPSLEKQLSWVLVTLPVALRPVNYNSIFFFSTCHNPWVLNSTHTLLSSIAGKISQFLLLGICFFFILF